MGKIITEKDQIKFCPIMTIGFAPPDSKNEDDLRYCMTDCMWYNKEEDNCNINILVNRLEESQTVTVDLFDSIADLTLQKHLVDDGGWEL